MSAFLALPVRLAAIQALLALYGVSFWHMGAAMDAGHHHLWSTVFRARGLGGLLGCVARGRLALLAKPPNASKHDDQPNEVFHATRPNTTSSTKREPA